MRTGISSPVLGMQETDGLDGLRCFHGTGDGTILVAEVAALIAMQQGFRDTATASHFVTQPATDALCAAPPKNNLFLHVDDAEACGQAFEGAATDVAVVK
jgi:hypothetical protein